MEGLGRVFNVVADAEGTAIDSANASALAFVLVGADTYTFQTSALATGASPTNHDVVRVWENDEADGSDTWELRVQTASEDVVVGGDTDVAVVHIDVKGIADGDRWVLVSSAATGEVVAIVYDLTVQREPSNLPVLSG
jgi:hypothetical protein